MSLLHALRSKTKITTAIFSTLYFFNPLQAMSGTNEAEQLEVLSLSAAIIDHIIFIKDEELKEFASEKGSWQPIDHPTLCNYLSRFRGEKRMSPGGSGVNVLKGLAHLGHRTAVVGKVGSDDMGQYVIEELKKKGITPFFKKEASLPTGQAICFITPDGQRTFRSYLGASHSLSDLDLKPELFETIKLFHIEGYQLVDQKLVRHALKIAKDKNIKISIDLANTEIIRRHKPFILEIIQDYVDIVLCNQDEARELTGLHAKEASLKIADLCSISVVTMGEKGCWTTSGETHFFTPAFAVEPIDSTGAGDYFASGFLHGILTGAPLQTCSLQGSLVAYHCVIEVGTEICKNSWKWIHTRLQPHSLVTAH